VRTSAFALALLLVLAGSASAGSGLVFRRADGSPIAFPRAVRTWCESDGLHIATLATIKQSRWGLHIAKGSVRSGRTLAFSWERPNGVGILSSTRRRRTRPRRERRARTAASCFDEQLAHEEGASRFASPA